jgi:DNA-binding NarL/FixJ family response regulator
MPIIDGLEATRVIRSRLPHVRVVILTSSDDPSDRACAQAAGAHGYLTKGCSLRELESAVTRGHALSPVLPRSEVVRTAELAAS